MLGSFQTPKRYTPRPPFTRSISPINPWAESGLCKANIKANEHHEGCSTRGNAENANDALCIFEGIENRFRGHLLSNMAHRCDLLLRHRRRHHQIPYPTSRGKSQAGKLWCMGAVEWQWTAVSGNNGDERNVMSLPQPTSSQDHTK